MEKHDMKDVEPDKGSDYVSQAENVGIENGKEERLASSQIDLQHRSKAQDNSIWIDVLAFVGGFLVANLVGGLIGAIINRGNDTDPEFGTFISYIVAFGLAIAFAMWLRIRRKANKPLIKFSLKKANGLLILFGVILVIVTSVVLEPLLNLFPSEYIDALYNTIGTGGWAIMTSIVAAPILEETLFRGILQQSLTEKLGGWRGVLLASAIFGVIHIIPQQVVNAFFIGLVLGYIYIKTNSILPVILIHAINNAIAFIQMAVFGDEALTTTRDMIGSDVWYWVVYGVSCAVFVGAFVGLWWQLKKVPPVRIADAGNNK